MKYRNEVTQVVTNLIAADCLPTLGFSSNTTIGGLLMAYPSNRQADLNNVEAATVWLNELYSRPNELLDVELDLIAASLVKGIKDAIDQIKVINSVVSDLSKKIDEHINNSIALDPKLASLLANQANQPVYASIDLSGLDNLSGFTPDAVVESMGFAEGTPKSIMYARILDVYMTKNIKELGDIVIDEAKEDDGQSIAEMVNQLLGDKCTIDDVNYVLQLLTSANRISGLVERTKKTFTFETPIRGLMYALETLRTIGPVLDTLYSKLNVHGYSYAELDNNYRAVTTILELCYYFVEYELKERYSDTVLMPNGMLNPRMLKTYTTSGMTMLDLARHVEYIYGARTLPMAGVTMQQLEEAREKVAKLYEEKQTVDSTYRRRELGRIKRISLIRVASEYFAGLLNPGRSNFITSKADQLLREDVPMEDLLFRIIMVIQFNDQPTLKLLYDNLGKALIATLKEHPDASEAVINRAMLDTYLDIATTIISKLVCKK